MKIYFIKNNTTFGPFFSSVEKAREYLQDPYVRCEGQDIESVIDGTSPYSYLAEVELDDPSTCFDS